MKETFEVLLFVVLVFACVYLIFRLAKKARGSGGGIMTAVYGATYEFYNKDKREAIEEVVEMKAHKKMEEQSTGKPVGDIPEQKL